MKVPRESFLLLAFSFLSLPIFAQFVDNFNGSGTPKGWVFITGDGAATLDFKQKNGIASLFVDATKDQLGIWWALTRHGVNGIDMKKLIQPEYELRVETRIRVSHAPRRVNLHVNHQRTIDFHSHLMEFDIPDTMNWHTISMTTRDLQVRPGDSINAHLALMDWGHGRYRVDFDYFKADVVNRATVGKDLGDPMPYHPPVADPATYPSHVDVAQDAMIDSRFVDLNFNNWHALDGSGVYTNVLTVSATQMVILRWDFSALKGNKIKRAGLLELSPYSIQRNPDFKKDFGMVRIAEILGGDPLWDEKSVTYNTLRGNQPMEEIINTQMIIDDSVTWNENSKVLFTISTPVLQRLIDGKTRGLAIKPLGSVNASFYSRENKNNERKARLYLEMEP
jgi:hypothetical protein